MLPFPIRVCHTILPSDRDRKRGRRRFLTRYQDLFASGDVEEHGRGAEIHVVAVVCRAVAASSARAAIPVEHVGAGRLRPVDLAGRDVHGNDGVRGFDIGVG